MRRILFSEIQKSEDIPSGLVNGVSNSYLLLYTFEEKFGEEGSKQKQGNQFLSVCRFRFQSHPLETVYVTTYFHTL